MMSLTCTKEFPDIPFAHRQWKHDGHCKLIHGHNWSFVMTFVCTTLDENGFVVDFGKLKRIKVWIAENLDHACVLCNDDPERELFCRLEEQGLMSIHWTDNASSEGLCKHLADVVASILDYDFKDRGVRLSSITIKEDSKNSATLQLG